MITPCGTVKSYCSFSSQLSQCIGGDTIHLVHLDCWLKSDSFQSVRLIGCPLDCQPPSDVYIIAPDQSPSLISLLSTSHIHLESTSLLSLLCFCSRQLFHSFLPQLILLVLPAMYVPHDHDQHEHASSRLGKRLDAPSPGSALNLNGKMVSSPTHVTASTCEFKPNFSSSRTSEAD